MKGSTAPGIVEPDGGEYTLPVLTTYKIELGANPRNSIDYVSKCEERKAQISIWSRFSSFRRCGHIVGKFSILRLVRSSIPKQVHRRIYFVLAVERASILFFPAFLPPCLAGLSLAQVQVH